MALWFQARGQASSLAEQSGMRLAILSIGAFLVVGLILLALVDERKAREATMKSPVERVG